MNGDLLAASVVNGLMLASVYALVALGLTVVFGLLDIVNFAQGQILLLGAYLKRDRGFREATVATVFELFPVLRERREQPAGTLSGGEQQMLAIGRALMAGPRLLLLDEPSLGIAPLLVQRIFDSLQAINQRGITILLVEQRLQQALRLAARGYVLQTGRVTVSGPTSELLGSEDVRRAYLGI